jgi:hypothetical protein
MRENRGCNTNIGISGKSGGYQAYEISVWEALSVLNTESLKFCSVVECFVVRISSEAAKIWNATPAPLLFTHEASVLARSLQGYHCGARF